VLLVISSNPSSQTGDGNGLGMRLGEKTYLCKEKWIQKEG